MSESDGKRARRKWSPEEKRQIVEEAIRPGASVAEIARRNGVNANLVFTRRKRLQPATTLTGVAERPLLQPPTSVEASPSASELPEFVPIGVFTRTNGGPGLQVQPAPASDRTDVARPTMQERPGVIEIDLVDGTRLRVDAFVNERVLRRVLAVLKAAS